MFIPLNKNKIFSTLKDQNIQLVVEQSVDSTNTYLKNVTTDFPVSICIAEQQTKGRGRLNRPWQSPFGENIYCSFKFSYSNHINKLSGLSLAISVALHKTLQIEINHPQLKIKWPNDLLFNGKKLSGVLVELCDQAVIIGFGINANMISDSENKITQAWTSLKEISHADIDRNALISILINEVIQTWQQFLTSGLNEFLDYYHEHDFLLNKIIKLQSGNEIYEGRMLGVNNAGQLRLQLQDNSIVELHSGEAGILKN